MWPIARKLALGIILIAAAASVLLFSDLNRRKRSTSNIPHVALMQYASNRLLDEGVAGVLDGLAEQGFVPGSTIAIQQYNAQADMPTANSIASEITDGRFKTVITVSTPCLQVVASANKTGKAVHVFGLVTDPYGAGVGISGPGEAEHPRHLIGIGTFQPVERVFEVARQMLPMLQRVGVVWNPSESCSQACTLKARRKCSELGIELLEATIDAPTGVSEAAKSLIARQVQALWVGGDNTVTTALDPLISAASAAALPVMTNAPMDVERGALFAIGADYYEVGQLEGRLAAKVLRGADTTTLRVDNVVPERLAINELATASLKERWLLPPALVKQAQVLVTKEGTKDSSERNRRRQGALASSKPGLAKMWNIRLIKYNETPPAEESIRGMRDALARSGLTLGRDYTLKEASAQSDIATLSNMMKAVQSELADMVMVISTPTLQSAVRHIEGIPIVFTCVASGVLAGAGKSDIHHRPNVTGITTVSSFAEMAGVLKECMPQATTVGTLFTPAEINSSFYRNQLENALKEKGITLVSVPANTASDIADAALSLCQKKIDAVCQLADNLTAGTFSSISRQAEKANLPIFSFIGSQSEQGAVLAVARDYYDAGLETGELAVRIMRGESPANIPFSNVKTTRLVVNLGRARQLGLKIPDAIVRRADKVLN
jgi:ABC-type uncharacterized transport system substrate-binding protein